MKRLRVKSRHFTYDVVAGRGAWRAVRPWLTRGYSSVFVLTERPLWSRWGGLFSKESNTAGARVLFVEPGERSKNLRTIERLAVCLLGLGADRRSLLILFGGGVIGDLGGFLASVYMRGIDCIQVPTTIVAQVDSAIGGKTAVNTARMKNLIGSFYPPRLVVADPGVLTSLDLRSFRSGLFEVVKHGILAGDPLFRQLEDVLDSLRPTNVEALEPLLVRAAAVKVDVVNRDEREARLRHVLNLGHTFGHALEEATRYQRFLHGEAVGWGLLIVARMARRMGLLAEPEERRISQLVRRVSPLPPIRDLDPRRVLPLLSQDKKAVGGRIRWVLPLRVGKVKVTSDVPLEVAAAAFRDAQRDGNEWLDAASDERCQR